MVERNPFIFFWLQSGERGEGKWSEEEVREHSANRKDLMSGSSGCRMQE